MAKPIILDPAAARYHRDYPKFPGVQTCVELLQRPNVRGAYLDALLFDLGAHLSECLAEVITAFYQAEAGRVRALLIGQIAEAKLAAAVPFLVENLQAPDESVRHWAIVGLSAINTKEARRALWQARAYTCATPEETAEFRRELARRSK